MSRGQNRRSVRSFPPRTGPRPLAIALGLWVRWLRIPVRFSALFPLVIVLVTALFTAVGDPGSLPLVVGGALVFALAHLGYYPVSAWPLLLVVFLVGIVTGWLVDRRGTLLAAGIAHGFVG